MTNTERLTELICQHIQTDSCLARCNNPYCSDCKYMAEYLTKNGCLMTPWNIGDTVYYVNPLDNTIQTDTVVRLTITKSAVKPILDKHNAGFWTQYTWFRTDEEANEFIKEVKA